VEDLEVCNAGWKITAEFVISLPKIGERSRLGESDKIGMK